MPRTRADQLRYALLFALGRVKVQGRKGVITQEQRDEIADQVIRQLGQHGDLWRLGEPVPEPPLTPSWDWKGGPGGLG